MRNIIIILLISAYGLCDAQNNRYDLSDIDPLLQNGMMKTIDSINIIAKQCEDKAKTLNDNDEIINTYKLAANLYEIIQKRDNMAKIKAAIDYLKISSIYQSKENNNQAALGYAARAREEIIDQDIPHRYEVMGAIFEEMAYIYMSMYSSDKEDRDGNMCIYFYKKSIDEFQLAGKHSKNIADISGILSQLYKQAGDDEHYLYYQEQSKAYYYKSSNEL